MLHPVAAGPRHFRLSFHSQVYLLGPRLVFSKTGVVVGHLYIFIGKLGAAMFPLFRTRDAHHQHRNYFLSEPFDLICRVGWLVLCLFSARKKLLIPSTLLLAT